MTNLEPYNIGDSNLIAYVKHCVSLKTTTCADINPRLFTIVRVDETYSHRLTPLTILVNVLINS